MDRTYHAPDTAVNQMYDIAEGPIIGTNEGTVL